MVDHVTDSLAGVLLQPGKDEMMNALGYALVFGTLAGFIALLEKT
jgi:hypothetical protein